jgi:hypothetical protein
VKVSSHACVVRVAGDDPSAYSFHMIGETFAWFGVTASRGDGKPATAFAPAAAELEEVGAADQVGQHQVVRHDQPTSYNRALAAKGSTRASSASPSALSSKWMILASSGDHENSGQFVVRSVYLLPTYVPRVPLSNCQRVSGRFGLLLGTLRHRVARAPGRLHRTCDRAL